MSATERQILDDFDAKNLHKRVAETMCVVEKMPFRGSIQSHAEKEAGPKSIQTLEAGRVMEAEGYVLQAHMERGYELEATRQNAEHSWNRSLGQVEQP